MADTLKCHRLNGVRLCEQRLWPGAARRTHMRLVWRLADPVSGSCRQLPLLTQLLDLQLIANAGGFGIGTNKERGSRHQRGMAALIDTLLTSRRTLDLHPRVTLEHVRAQAHTFQTRGSAATLPIGVDHGPRSDDARMPPEQSVAIRRRTRRRSSQRSAKPVRNWPRS